MRVNILTLIEKANLLMADVKASYERGGFTMPTETVTPDDLDEIEKQLSIVLPNDMRAIAPIFCSNNYGFEQLSLMQSDGYGNVIEATFRFRRDNNLPDRYLVLSDFDETFVLLSTANHRDLPATVYWMDETARDSIGADPFPRAPIMTFGSYEEYFSWFLDRELEGREK